MGRQRPGAWPPPQPPPGQAERTQVIQVGAVTREPKPIQPVPPGPPGHPAPAQSGQTAPQRLDPADEPEQPVERRKPRIGLLVAMALVVVVVLGAAAAVQFVPELRAKLGITAAEPEVTIAPPPGPVQFTPTLKGPGAANAAPSSAGVRAALAGPASDPVLGTLTGTVVDPANGEVLFAQNADTTLVPASTAKLLTCAAALLALPHAAQLPTKVVAGDKPGTVIIIGGGDPTLSSFAAGKNTVYPGAAHLDDLVEQVKAKGPVTTVLLDLDRYSGESIAKGWIPADVAGGYIAPMVPAMLDGGRADPTKAVSPRSANPARSLAEEFAKRIGGGATVPAKATAQAKADAQVLGEVRSAPVVELVDNVLQRSDNVLAEAMAREVAKATGQQASFEGGAAATIKTLKDNGFDTSTVTLDDGSGLSTLNQVSAALLADVLKVAAAPDGADPRTAKLRPLLGALPVAGGSGTLAGRYQGPAAAPGKGWVRAKTGTLSSVNSLAGVVLDTDGRLLVFALMSNGSVPGAAQPALDAVAAALRQCGCR
ncbi:D-alanyl-D-alanine carboxypeptidase/D-alanyl-D-alanine-endopeptidase (penicillin-binding protein 4) [Actinokineospora cianjurensis]|uniref:D-alanyl-D-alanine carboxypeptidase/D-alanyl-D-alanine-endopeptidase (Penicillin-binding protein 4) n=1 Tax=Actinokineospora cianjurensis TaxID=585224 RepID=A0A421B5S7_9PSEU|nr:D-alanyl-D-alanine carboxypeptidase/D-alanyl-D-alanine-endopeptidase (penicillin-binding protein 4) [Actinokineospora cianjurensis]